eukprot:1157335-Pelagomonas_calceolata.AAC.4
MLDRLSPTVCPNATHTDRTLCAVHCAHNAAQTGRTPPTQYAQMQLIVTANCHPYCAQMQLRLAANFLPQYAQTQLFMAMHCPIMAIHCRPWRYTADRGHTLTIVAIHSWPWPYTDDQGIHC